MTFKKEKTCSILMEIVSSFINSKSEPGVIVSVTKIEMSDDLRKAKIFINAFPEDKENETFRSLKKKLWELKDYVKSKMKSRFLPHFEIEIDKGEKNRQRIEELLK